MTVGSFCTGICAPECAWRSLGWEPLFFSEIDPFACAVERHHFPHVPNLGDMEKIDDATLARYRPDVVCAGTPCQAFSVGGERRGLADPRGNLTLKLLGFLDCLRSGWLVWENVAGVLSIDGGRTFGTILWRLAKLGYGWAYRILDAGNFGCRIPRPRLFLVAHLGGANTAAAVLFDRAGFSGHPAWDIEQAKAAGTPAVFTCRGGMAHDDRSNYILDDAGLRTSTPLEWERALGFPENWTLIEYRGKPAKNGPRHHALGNSMAVPVLAWIGRRIELVERVIKESGVAA